MREIKFKIWDKVNKEWLEYKERVIGWQAPFVKELIPLKAWVYGSKDGTAFNTLQYCIDSEDFEVVQSAGLKDKQGKEIYEGDVVGGWVYDYDGPFEVFFNEGAFSLKATIEDDGYYPCLYNLESSLEIIGDIYENPELLNKE